MQIRDDTWTVFSGMFYFPALGWLFPSWCSSLQSNKAFTVGTEMLCSSLELELRNISKSAAYRTSTNSKVWDSTVVSPADELMAVCSEIRGHVSKAWLRKH